MKNSHLIAVGAVLLSLVSSGVSFAKPKPAPIRERDTPEYVVKTNGSKNAVYQVNVFSDDLICEVQSDGTCDDDQNRVGKVIVYSYDINYSSGSGSKWVKRAKITLILDTNGKPVGHDTDVSTIKNDPMLPH